MATQKQRKRRAKEKRHDYDLVEIDEEGNETVLTATDVRPNDPPARMKGNERGKGTKPKASAGRAVQPPSWRRVLRRGMIFAPIMFATLLLIGGDSVTTLGAVANTVVLMGVFIPFSYLMDRLLYRQYEKRRAREAGG